jgi:transposase-like protein
VPGPTPHYPPEFKREAVELYRSSDKGFHEKASLVKVNVGTKAPTIQDQTPLPRFHSL